MPAITVTHNDGSRALDLRYSEHKISSGKYNIPGLPAVYAAKEEAETLEIVMEDTATSVSSNIKIWKYFQGKILLREMLK